MDACRALAKESKGLKQLFPPALLVLTKVDVAVAYFITCDGNIVFYVYQEARMVLQLVSDWKSEAFNLSPLHR